jgi:hypothetical protein
VRADTPAQRRIDVDSVTNRLRRIPWLLLLASGCVIATENVTYEPRGAQYPGYRIEYVEATPDPGTLLTPGVPVRFYVTVRYTLQVAERGHLALAFLNRNDVDLVPTQEVLVPIARGTTQTATLSQEVVIPPGVTDLTVRVPLLPEGVRNPVGALRLRYPVSRARPLDER